MKSEAKKIIAQLLGAIALIGSGAACFLAGLGYLAASLWHALVPLLGSVGADISLGGFYIILAAIMVALGCRMIR